MPNKKYTAEELAEIRRAAGTIDLGEEVRAEIKSIWEDGIKKYPEIEPLGKSLIGQLKRNKFGNPKKTDDVDKARSLYLKMLNMLKEESNGTD